MDRLYQRGYRQVGIYGYSPQGMVYQRLGKPDTARPVYAVNLPSQAPVMIQADWLAAFCATLASATLTNRSTWSPIPLAASPRAWHWCVMVARGPAPDHDSDTTFRYRTGAPGNRRHQQWRNVRLRQELAGTPFDR